MNTYLIANGVWVVVIHAMCSNRFAYLSWFMLPWVLFYPFVLGKAAHQPRVGAIAATLLAHHAFTYLMLVVIYPMRGLFL